MNLRLLLPCASLVLLAACSAGPTATKLHPDWQPYDNAAQGYSMKLPPMWDIGHAQVGGDIVAFNDKDATYKLEVFTQPTASADVTEYLKKYDAEMANGFEGQPSLRVDGSSDVMVAGLRAVERREYGLASDMHTLMTYILHGGKMMEITFMREDGKELSASDLALARDIIATLVIRK